MMVTTTSPVGQALDFLTLIYGVDAPGYLPVWRLTDKCTEWMKANDLEAIAHRSIALAQRHDVYFGIGLHAESLGPSRRGEMDTVSGFGGTWTDLDYGTVGHKSARNPPTLEDAISIVQAFPLPPGAVVHSGHGLHAWWPFREFWTFDTPEERETAQHLVQRFQATILERARERGWEIDSTFNLAQVLRLPGTWNRKAEPVEVHLREFHPERRYSPDELEPYLIDVEAWQRARPVELPNDLPAVNVDDLQVPPWIKDLIRKGEDSDHYKSGSEMLWRIERELIEAKHADTTIAAVLLDPNNAGGEKVQRQGPRWFRGELGRARAWKRKPSDLRLIVPQKDSAAAYRTNGADINGKISHGDNGPPPPGNPAVDQVEPAPLLLPSIVVSNRPLRDITEDALEAVYAQNDPPGVFVRSGELTRVREDEQERPIVEAIGESHLRGVMARTADYYRITSEKVKDEETGESKKRPIPIHVAPPKDVVLDALALGTWQVPPLEAVAEAPTLRPDGSILNVPGYDSETKLLYRPSRGLYVPEVPDHPTAADRARALELLDEAIGQFPYADEISRANTLGTMLTPIVRPAIQGHTPLALFDKPRAGTGSSLLADVIALIATGRAAGMMTAPRREEEWKKSILAILVNGSTVITIDNIEHQLVSASLASALTTHYVEDRVLGQTAMIRAPQRATWIATGNNIRLGGDMPRRCYWVRMDAKVARPWERTGFKHPDLAGWTAKHRGELLWALLTLARSWWVDGKPAADVPTMGSFEEWSKTIGGILAHAGVGGFLGNLSELWDQADALAGQWEVFLARWYRGFGDRAVTVADLCNAIDIEDTEGQTIRDVLPDDLAEAAGDKVLGDDGEAKPPRGGFRNKLGRALEGRADAIFDGYQLVRKGRHSNTKAVLWGVVAESLAESPSEVLAF